MNHLPTVLTLSTAAFLLSCTVNDDGGSCPEQQTTMITGLDQTTLLAQSDAQLDSGLVQFDILETSQPVQADRFMIAVAADVQFVAAEHKTHSSLLARISNFLVSNASALSCIAPEFVSQEPLADITITSDAAVSALYPTGSNLAAAFRVGKLSLSSPGFGAAIGPVVARAPENRELITEYLSAQPLAPLLLAMTMDIDDPVASQHVFTITYTLDNGSIYTAQTEAVSITP